MVSSLPQRTQRAQREWEERTRRTEARRRSAEVRMGSVTGRHRGEWRIFKVALEKYALYVI